MIIGARLKLSLIILFMLSCSEAYAQTATEAEMKKQIITESIASYRGNCPCPYNLARNGSSCGKRSAYSKPGGASPICYDADITPEMLEKYKQRSHKNN